MRVIKVRKLFQRTLFGVFTLFGFIGISTSILLIDTVNTYLSEEYETNSQGIAQSIADASVDILLNRDLAALQSLIDQFIEIQGINYVYIIDEAGEFLAHTFVPGIPEQILTADPSSTATVERQISGMGAFVEVSSPILAGVAGTLKPETLAAYGATLIAASSVCTESAACSGIALGPRGPRTGVTHSPGQPDDRFRHLDDRAESLGFLGPGLLCDAVLRWRLRHHAVVHYRCLWHPGRGQAVTAQSGNEGHGFPMTMGNGGNHPLAAGTAPPQARHFGIDTCFVKEHDPADPLGMGREPGLTLAPNHACCLPIRAFLFTGVGGFFKKLILRARNQSLIVEVGAITW